MLLGPCGFPYPAPEAATATAGTLPANGRNLATRYHTVKQREDSGTGAGRARFDHVSVRCNLGGRAGVEQC